MKQVSQNKKTGELNVAEVPAPALGEGMLLVKNYASVISAGTEKTTIDNRKANWLDRAKSQPEEVKKVIDEVKRTGLMKTYTRIMTKLDSAAPLGYSTAGVVLAVDGVQDIEPGDRVACAGAEYAFHSDVIIVPRNLAAKIPDGVSMKSAAYSTVAAIALQGIRQAEPTLGETVVVIGLGLLGQLTVQMLKANGCRVVGVDLDPFALDLAKRSGADLVLHRFNDDVEKAVLAATSGYGADAVIVTAGTKNNDPVVLAGAVSREKGRVVIVGATTMEIPRTTYYMKEVDIRISRSYGPGRYHPSYERKGLDFPIGYVRWTENRNMQAFLQLAQAGRVNTDLITTHTFPVDKALEAYGLIEGEKTEPYVGIVLTYDDLAPAELAAITTPPQPTVRISQKRGSLTVGFIGAGGFASGYLIPHLKEMPDVTLDTVCNRTGLTGADMRNKFGFRANTTNAEDVFSGDAIGTVFIATRHGEHADYTLRGLRNGQHVFVEKPLALNDEELDNIEAFFAANPGLDGKVQLMVGFNRRFSPLVTAMRSFIASTGEPSVIHYYINAGFLPKDHWTQDPREGGGRIVGEVCHFIDAIQYLTNATPVRVYAECINSPSETVTNYDNVNITLRMSDGSVGVITYASNGDSSIPKERIVLSCGNSTAVMDNFMSLTLARSGKRTVHKSPGDKGHKAEVVAFMDAIRKKAPQVIPLESLFATTRTTFRILDSLRLKESVEVKGS